MGVPGQIFGWGLGQLHAAQKYIDPRKRFLKMSTSYIHFKERFLRPQQQENVRKTSRYI